MCHMAPELREIYVEILKKGWEAKSWVDHTGVCLVVTRLLNPSKMTLHPKELWHNHHVLEPK